MILMGDYTTIPDETMVENLVIFNLSSPLEGYPYLNISPPFNINFTYDNQFDKLYYQYLIQNDNAFMNFMNVIINEDLGNNVYLLINKNGSYSYIAEALNKLIQVRYGIIVQEINEMSDYEQVRYDTDMSFSVFGLQNLAQDKQRYLNMLAESGQLPIEE